MRTAIAVVALACAAGGGPGEAAGQDESRLVFQRVCNIERGQEDAAAALARDLVELVERKYPGAGTTARTGRWMTGSQNIERPVDQILFSERHPDLETRLIFNEILLGDAEFRALQRKLSEVTDLDSCTETRYRARR